MGKLNWLDALVLIGFTYVSYKLFIKFVVKEINVLIKLKELKSNYKQLSKENEEKRYD